MLPSSLADQSADKTEADPVGTADGFSFYPHCARKQLQISRTKYLQGMLKKPSRVVAHGSEAKHLSQNQGRNNPRKSLLQFYQYPS